MGRKINQFVEQNVGTRLRQALFLACDPQRQHGWTFLVQHHNGGVMVFGLEIGQPKKKNSPMVGQSFFLAAGRSLE